MAMRNSVYIFVLGVSLFISGCGTDPAVNNANTPANVNTSNASKANTASDGPVKVTTPTPSEISNNAPTLTPIYKAYCAAVVKKDEAAIKKFFTSDTLKSFEQQMKGENIKTLSEYVDPVTNEVCEVSNEQIKGDKAVARVKTVSYPNGFEVLFVKENGEWKMSNIDPKREGF